MDKDKHIGFRVCELEKLLHKAINRNRTMCGMDPMVIKRGWIVGYLAHNKDKIICQKDIESLIHMPKSSVTDTLNVLEKAGLIERVAIENDARRKRIVLTSEGEAFSQETERNIEEVESYIREGIPQEDMDTFFRVLKTMSERAIAYSNNKEV